MPRPVSFGRGIVVGIKVIELVEIDGYFLVPGCIGAGRWEFGRRCIRVDVLLPGSLDRIVQETENLVVRILRQRLHQLEALQDVQQLRRRCRVVLEELLRLRDEFGVIESTGPECAQDSLEHRGGSGSSSAHAAAH
jgi:hypothetical protein